MDAIFTNSKNSETSDSHRLLPNLSDKIILKKTAKYVALSNLSAYYIWKNMENVIQKDLKGYSLCGMKNLNYLMNHILYQIFKIFLNTFKKKNGEKTDTLQ